VNIRACTLVATLTACAPATSPQSARLPPQPAAAPAPASPTATSPSPAPAPAPPAPSPSSAARPWERWPTWGYLEAGSATLRTRLEELWGGLAELGRGQLSLLTNKSCACDPFAVALAALGDLVDPARPVRQLATRDERSELVWAIAFAASERSSDKLPAICLRTSPADLAGFHVLETPPGAWCEPCTAVDRPGDRAIVCGKGDAADALRADFVARGWPVATDRLHAEQRGAGAPSPSAVVLDLRESAGALQATMRVTPRTPPAGSVSKAAHAAASRVHARSPRVHVGDPAQAFGLDLQTPLRFDGFDIHIPTPTGRYHARISDRSLVFVEDATVDKLAPHLIAYLRRAQSKGTMIVVEPMRVPPGLPAGTRGIRGRERTRTSGEISICPPGRCRVVGREPPLTFRTSHEYLLIPAEGGTWIATGGDRMSVVATLEVITSTATPPTWTLPAVALGKQSTARAEWFWAEHLRDDGDLEVEIAGSIKP
jgi:hypothetical protein